MSVYNDIEWGAKRNKERCEYNSQTVANYAREFPRGHWSFLRPGSEEKWYGTFTDKPDGSWNRSAENMMANFSGSGHSYFVPVPLREENYEAKEEARCPYTSMVVVKTSSCFSAQ